METLIFQLQGPLSSWGDAAVGEYRPSAEYPSQSAILGLLAAALGIDRADDGAHTVLRRGCRMAVGMLSPGRLLRDFHTAQVPGRVDLKGRPQATRRDELALPKQALNTILSTRDYRQDGSFLVAMQAVEGATHALADLAEALRYPKFHLYLGRKACPPDAPLHPCLIDAPDIGSAMRTYLQDLVARQSAAGFHKTRRPATIKSIAWGDNFGADDGAMIGVPRHMSVIRKDVVLARNGWQFGDRNEHIALLEEE